MPGIDPPAAFIEYAAWLARNGSEPDRVPEPYMAKLCVAHSRHWRSAQL